MVSKLFLFAFRSILSETVQFDNPTLFVGQNGSGKSNFADAFAFMAEAMNAPLQTVLDRRGGIAAVSYRTGPRRGSETRPWNGRGRIGPRRLGLGIECERNGEVGGRSRYSFLLAPAAGGGVRVLREQCIVDGLDGARFWFDRRRTSFDTNIAGLEPSLDPGSLGLPVIGGDTRFNPLMRMLSGMRVYAIHPGSVREAHDPDAASGLRSDGSNSASILREIRQNAPQDFERVLQLLAVIVPKTVGITPKRHGSKLSLEFSQDWGEAKAASFDAANISDGTLRAVGLLTAVFQRPTPTLLVLEEPEASIHPGALDAILDLIRIASRRTQVIVTTHSPEILDAKWIEGNRCTKA
jgi:predicted ATPase